MKASPIVQATAVSLFTWNGYYKSPKKIDLPEVAKGRKQPRENESHCKGYEYQIN